MAGNQIGGDGIPASLAGMSKNQLHDIMCQMKTLIEQNKQQARQILIQNPALTRALFQAQIMLGMVQSPQAAPPTISSTTSRNSQPSAVSNQPSNIQASSSVPGQTQMNKRQPIQAMTPNSQSQNLPPPNPQPQPVKASHPLQQEPKAQFRPQSTPISIPQPSQVPHMSQQLPQHIASPPPSHNQTHMPSFAAQSQQSVQNIGNQYLPLQPPLQPPLPPQPRPPMQGFSHQGHAQMGPNMSYQQPSGSQYHPQQHQMFHSGAKPPSGMGPSFPQGQMPPPNQHLPPSHYQAGNPHLGMDYNQAGSSKQTDNRGSSWMPGPPENTMSQLPGPPSFAGQMGAANQPPRPPPLTPDLENALLQQVMSLTPEQINLLPTDQRNQVLQLQQALRR